MFDNGDDVKDNKAQANEDKMEDSDLDDPLESKSWYDMSSDEPDEAALGTSSNIWEQRKKNAIKEASVRAEDQSAKRFWQMRKDEQDTAKTCADKDIEKLADTLNKNMIHGLSEADKEFEKLKEQLKGQSEHNQKEVQKIVAQQEQSNIHFQTLCDKINENLDNKINELFSSFNTAMQGHAETATATAAATAKAAEGTQKQFQELDKRFSGIEKLLAQILAAQENEKPQHPDVPDAKKARGSED